MKSRKILAAVMAPVCAVSAMAVVASASSASTNTETVVFSGSADLTGSEMSNCPTLMSGNLPTAAAGDILTVEYDVDASATYAQIQFAVTVGDDWNVLPQGDYNMFDLDVSKNKATITLTAEQAALLANSGTNNIFAKGKFITLKKVTFTHVLPGSSVSTEIFSGSADFTGSSMTSDSNLYTGNIPSAVEGDFLDLEYTVDSGATYAQIALAVKVGDSYTWTDLPQGQYNMFDLNLNGKTTIVLNAEQAALLAGADTKMICAKGKFITLTKMTFTHVDKSEEESSESSNTSESSTTSSESSTTSSESSTTSSESSTTSSESSTTTSSDSSTTTSESKPATSDEDKPAGDDKTDSTDKTETPGATDKAETVTNTVTVDKVLKGAELSKAVFGDSKKEWKDVETITFESDEPFAVVFDVKAGKIKGDDKATSFVKGVNELAKADLPAEAFATKWTLSKDEVAAMLEADPTGENTQIISKDGKKIQVKATVTLKADAASDDKTDNKNTGIALAVAPVILAGAAVAIVALKKRK